MEPLSAFGLACNVIQVIDFATKVTVNFQDLYKAGALSENKQIESMSKHLTNLVTDLRQPHSDQTSESALQLYRDDHELQEVAQQCSETATHLVEELQKLSIQGQHKKRDAFRKAIKNFGKVVLLKTFKEA